VDDKGEAQPDAKKIIADIEAHIRLVSGDAVCPMGMDDIDWKSIEKIVKKEEDDEKERKKNQAARSQAPKACNCGACHTAGGAIAAPVDPNVIVAELDAVEKMVDVFKKGVDDLKKDMVVDMSVAKIRATGLRDVVLRELVARFVKASIAIEQMRKP
jgi:mono/diheme cytochrome c family protein